VVLLSAVAGVPPLLLVSVYAARTRMSTPVFGLVCLLGRAIRFVALAHAPHLFT
jgi:membrane protein YqaA with SNARE-associated domain